MLKQTKNSTDRSLSLDLNGEYVELGTINDVIHLHDESNSITFSLDFKREDDENEINLLDPSGNRTTSIVKSRQFHCAAQVIVDNLAPISKYILYRLGQLNFSLTQRGDDTTNFELKSTSTNQGDDGFNFIRTKGRAWKLPRPIKSYAFPDQARTYFQNSGFLSELEAAYEREIDRVFYLGPLREFPKRDYLWARSKPTDVGQRGEKCIDAILAATEGREQRNLKPRSRLWAFQKMIGYWLTEMGLVHDFAIEEIAPGSNRWQARLRSRSGSAQVLLTDVGFGVSQVLPVITLLQYVPEGSTVILEQPEIHLHPLAQAALADVIIQAAFHRRLQVIVESHSEHLLLRLQRRIAEEKVNANDIKLYFCDAPEGVSQLTPLELDIFGNILNWPRNFMGDAFGETAAAEMKRIERRQKMRAAE
jgi:hypothetical protein